VVETPDILVHAAAIDLRQPFVQVIAEAFHLKTFLVRAPGPPSASLPERNDGEGGALLAAALNPPA